MKDESFLDSAGPVFIVVALLAVMVLTTWVMVRGNAGWGHTPQHVATAPAAPSSRVPPGPRW